MRAQWQTLLFYYSSFFLVTTSIETDSGMDRMLPSMETIPVINVKKKNILSITVNSEGDLLIDLMA